MRSLLAALLLALYLSAFPSYAQQPQPGSGTLETYQPGVRQRVIPEKPRERLVCLSTPELIFLFPKVWGTFDRRPCGIPESIRERLIELRLRQIAEEELMRRTA